MMRALVLDLFEGRIDIYEKETEKRLQKFLKIKKMSNHKYLENDLRLKKEELLKRALHPRRRGLLNQSSKIYPSSQRTT
jgi:hypothetical protein